jgi:transposase InsO family protein
MGIAISRHDLEEYKRNKCPTCILAKDKRYINKESFNKKEYDILERIHSDIGGPLSPTYNNYRYYITFLDKKSSYLWLYLLRHKNEAYQAFINYANIAMNNKNRKRIREFFSDNRLEYTNKCFQKALNNYSIMHNTTPIYTKEPNGLIERVNLTLLSKVRSLLIMANAPKYLWGEALLASVYLYNRTPHSALAFKTPYEVFHKEKPYIQNIRS